MVRSARAPIEAESHIERTSTPAIESDNAHVVPRSVENPENPNSTNPSSGASLGPDEVRTHPIVPLPEDVQSIAVEQLRSVIISLVQEMSTDLVYRLGSNFPREQLLQSIQPPDHTRRQYSLDEDQQPQQIIQPSVRNNQNTIDSDLTRNHSPNEFPGEGGNTSDLSPDPTTVIPFLENNEELQEVKQTLEPPEPEPTTATLTLGNDADTQELESQEVEQASEASESHPSIAAVHTSEGGLPSSTAAEDSEDAQAIHGRPLMEYYPICLDTFEEEEKTVWCKTQCGQSFQKTCMDTWRTSVRVLNCVIW